MRVSHQKVGLARLHLHVTVLELRGRVQLKFGVVFHHLPVVAVRNVLLLLPVDDDGLVFPVGRSRRRQEEKRIGRAARLAATVDVLGPHTKLVRPFGRQAVNHVRGRVAPVKTGKENDKKDPYKFVKSRRTTARWEIC